MVSTEKVFQDRFAPGRGRFRWLQRILFALLRWCRAEDIEVGHQLITVARPKIADWIEQHRNYCLMDWNQKVTVLLVGPREFEDLSMCCLKLALYWEPVHHHEDGKPVCAMRYLGLEIYVIPWMDGILALPPNKFSLLKFYE